MKSLNFFFLALFLLLIACSDVKQTTPNNQEAILPDSLQNTFSDYNLSFEKRVSLLINEMTMEEKIGQMMHKTPGIPRLGIPPYNWWNEALHGVARFGKATVYPQPIGMAATFDSDLVNRIASAISTEGRAKFNAAQKLENYRQYSGLTFWSPNVNIFRDARWGRGMETWGEDPFLTGRMGTAFTKGIQGNNEKYWSASACVKHFAVHNGPEKDRHHMNVFPSVRDFHETYLPAFEQVVKEGQVSGVMCAYNRLNDEPCCGSSTLLQSLLRQDWGFEGYIVTDCGAIQDFYKGHGVSKDRVEASQMALSAGVDLNCGTSFNGLKEAYKDGELSEEMVDKALSRLFYIRFKLGLFDPPELVPFSDLTHEELDHDKQKALAYEAALKSVVLLRNDNVLPLDPNLQNLYVIGPQAVNVDMLLGNYYGVSANMVTILEGITDRVNPGTNLEYRKGFYIDRDNVNKIDWAIGEANSADVTIAVMGINNELEGEEGESIGSAAKSDKVDLEIPQNQLDYLKKLRNNKDKPLIVIFTGGSPLNIEEVYEIADAVLWVWYPGEQGGNAVADILFGIESPSGKLPITFPGSVDKLPPYEDYSMEGRTYKYGPEDPLFPFGFGLSYTKFKYEINKVLDELNEDTDSVKFNVQLTNVGNREAEEVVQIYISPSSQRDLPKYNLVDFDRVKLAAGESVRLTYTLSSDKFQYVNSNGLKQFFDDTYYVWAGGSLPSQRSVELGLNNAVRAEVLVDTKP